MVGLVDHAKKLDDPSKPDILQTDTNRTPCQHP